MHLSCTLLKMSTDYQEAALYSLFRVGEYFGEKVWQFISPAYFCFMLSIYTVLYQKANCRPCSPDTSNIAFPVVIPAILSIIPLLRPILRSVNHIFPRKESHLSRAEILTSCTMMTSSNGNIFRETGPFVRGIHRSRWIPRTKASDAELWCFLMICVWINGWVNNRETGDLRRYHGLYDVNVMTLTVSK